MSGDYYPECSQCGRPLTNDYDVRRHEIEHPIKEGYWNPLTPDTWVHLAFGDDTLAAIERTCENCNPSEHPPEPSKKQHAVHAGVFLAAFYAALLAASPGAVVFEILFGLAFVGEGMQFDRILAEGESETDSSITDPAEEYVRGEIDEDELEERLGEEFDDTDDRETRVMER